MSEYKKKIIELIESNLTGYEISKKTGVSQYVLSQLRQGKREVDNLTLLSYYPEYNIAVSWQRLREGKTIKNKI